MTTIPPITDPLGKYWNQPDRHQILVDDTHAVMTRSTLKQLPNYSLTNPTGCYLGKMWRKEHIVWNENETYTGTDRWILCWFGIHEDPKLCTNNYREILLID